VDRSRRLSVLLAAALVGLVLAVYAQTYRHGFVEYDDLGYVRDNSVVRRGLTLYGVRWALTTGQLGNWIPLTWLSYMLDVRLFGISAGALHLVNVGLHLANTLLLFAVLLRMTGATWPSFAVAALFGIHPLHVESVAWIAERKDVLSTFFWFLCLWAYTRYAETGTARWYAALLGWFAVKRGLAPLVDLGREIELASGVTADDRIVTAPPDGLADGDQVRVIAGPKAGKPATASEKQDVKG